MELTGDVWNTMRIAKVFKDRAASINSLAFDDSGRFLATASDDDTITLYDAIQAT